MIKYFYATKKILHKNYTANQNVYQLKLPFDIDCIISDNDSVRLLSQFVEKIDLTELYSTYFRIRENQVPPMKYAENYALWIYEWILFFKR